MKDVSTVNSLSRLTLLLRSTWLRVLPDVPHLAPISTDAFQGYHLLRTDQGIGLYEGAWTLVHLHGEDDVIASAGPFDFPEQAVAALISQVAGQRATAVMAEDF